MSIEETEVLLKHDHLKAIAEGEITQVFRRWKRPTVRSGGTLRTRVGLLAIDAVEPVSDAEITKADVLRAGFTSKKELLDSLRSPREGDKLYRIKLHVAGDDPRVKLREQTNLSEEDIAEISRRLDRYDAASRRGPWTEQTLRLIAENPGTRAADLAASAGWEKRWLKPNVRRLKELGLTESLSPGYRLSPRGRAYLESGHR